MIIVSGMARGNSDDVLPNIFLRLYSTKTIGVGLGMPTDQQITLQHGGGIEIETEEGAGTKIIFWLPKL